MKILTVYRYLFIYFSDKIIAVIRMSINQYSRNHKDMVKHRWLDLWHQHDLHELCLLELVELAHTEQEAVNIPLETIVAMGLVMRQQSKWMQIKMPNPMQEKMKKNKFAMKNQKKKISLCNLWFKLVLCALLTKHFMLQNLNSNRCIKVNKTQWWSLHLLDLYLYHSFCIGNSKTSWTHLLCL